MSHAPLSKKIETTCIVVAQEEVTWLGEGVLV